MRRTAKPFTIEVKRAGRVRKNGQDSGVGDEGGDIRFRDAERMFRNSATLVEEPPAPFLPLFAEVAETVHAAAPLPERRILPDLIAEAAALSGQTGAAEPELPRRRGRPPKVRDGEVRATSAAASPTVEVDTRDVPAGNVMSFDFAPMLLDLAASARRRLARDTSRLPRAERWKRRLPKACW